LIKSKTSNKRILFGKTYKTLPELDLLWVQKESYSEFMVSGIEEMLHKISPIDDFTGKNWSLEFVSHRFGESKYTASEALEKGTTFAVALKVQSKLLNKQTGETIEEEIFLGDIPQMTTVGTFIINGIERAVVNQLVRSPGIFFSAKVDASTGRRLYSGELRPLRGSWLEFEVNRSDVITVKIDRHRKIPITTLLRAAGLSTDDEILETFKNVDVDKKHQYIFKSIEKDSSKNMQEALIEIYQKLRPGEPAVLENAQQLFHNMFFNQRRYELGKVGRFKLNKKLNLDIENVIENQVLTPKDLIAATLFLINLQNGKGKVDDIDHLANRRVRRVGELVLANAFQPGLLRLERSIKEKMSLAKVDSLVTPSSLVNPRPLVAVVNDFFKRNRLSTILDQTNPLSELDNLRRLSVMGRGGVTRERTSFSMRDINSSQYSRICPVRSPEGPNIGLVTYMSLYARINEYGFLEAPYRKVEKINVKGKTRMKVTDKIIYLSADDEENYYITHAEVDIDKNGYITDQWVPVRILGDFKEAPVNQVQLIDVVSRQVVGTSASLIPFLAHDEANRALMGTHMQCQAVPLVKTEAPIVGTGMESAVPQAMNRVVRIKAAGKVIYVDANQVIVQHKKEDIKKLKETGVLDSEFMTIDNKNITYKIQKFQRSAQSTSYSQRPVVTMGQKLNKNDIIIDGPACDNGELALGKNLLIAYASFEGLGYEDAVIISDKLVKEDILTSIHINEYDTAVMDTKLGPEELTRDIPNVSEIDLANLAEDGIVVVGSEVGPNDILVGKIAPKGETELTAEERLLRAIFGEKAREVRDTSLRMPHGEQGTVVDVQILDRKEGDELEPGVRKIVKVKVAQMRKVVVGDKLAGRHGNKGVISKIIPVADMPYLNDGTPIDVIISPLSVLARMNLGQLLEAHLGWAAQKLNYKAALPVFEKIGEETIENELKKAKLSTTGKVQLYDGRTGETFKEETAVGTGYILKLIHMVEDKTHARSTGPYSLVTQQPLGGKAQMGGQRLGEMEVWALEAHRAAYTLQEMLTIKSDDVVGRAKAFEAIVKDADIPEATIPESFKVLVKELNSLCLNIIPEGIIEEHDEKENEDEDKEDFINKFTEDKKKKVKNKNRKSNKDKKSKKN
jgi:DNA-directed RNA polymerase subunit beta